MKRVAACTCGALSVQIDGEPSRISVCHCFACQQRTGSAFAVQARFAREDAKVSGGSTAYVRTGDSGATATFHFCPTCGCTVYYLIDAMPDVIVIPVGAFTDSTFPGPKVAVYEARQHPWVRVEGIAEHYD
jgi:hypothetical protein